MNVRGTRGGIALLNWGEQKSWRNTKALGIKNRAPCMSRVLKTKKCLMVSSGVKGRDRETSQSQNTSWEENFQGGGVKS